MGLCRRLLPGAMAILVGTASLVTVGCVQRHSGSGEPTTNVSSIDIGKFTPNTSGPAWESMAIVFTEQASKKDIISKTLTQADFNGGNGGGAIMTLKVPYGSYFVRLQYFSAQQKVVYQSCADEQKKLQTLAQPQVTMAIKICDVGDNVISTLPTSSDVSIKPIPSDSGSTTQTGQGVAWLALNGNRLVKEEGQQPVVLRGVSTHGLQWFGQFANESAVKWLRDDWKISVIRAAMYTSPVEQGFVAQSSQGDQVTAVVDAAVKLGIYAIIDWHILNDGNPNQYKDQALSFFKEMAQKYGNTPNVIFEICNEPNGDVTWDRDIKPYAEQLVAAIRQIAPKNIIIIGTPTWSQDVDAAAASPVAGTNLMYSLHFYAGTHSQDLRNKADAALGKGIALFVTEWGVSQATGDGGVFAEESDRWLEFMAQRQMSWVAWNLSDKSESSAFLQQGASTTGGWTDQQLSPAGKYIKAALQR